ncbi:GIY-YIG nuclease family protein [uncultured Christiangramia sp.]|uniref:GIY-YIG nuclease family protein n=1 Tax=uncultured Christiangramia sp. TaxID=503836 RepID=UPI002605BCB1|nr:GIY-YIG nuclease family protein [uncultured Christiangramia sp.]
MKEHLKRRFEYSKDALPEKGTDEYQKISKVLQKRIAENPELKKRNKKSFDKAFNTMKVQHSNGVNLGIDQELRYYLREFNHRSWEYGHRKMPMMFNITEAFFNLDKTINSWKLLDEEDYLISFFNFIDFYTSNNFEYNIDTIKENIESDLIHNFHVNNDIKEISFKTENGKEFVISGISLVRRGNEVNILFLAGEVVNTIQITKELKPLKGSSVPGKENLKPAEEFVREAVRLNDDPDLWKTLIGCRFDLETESLDVKYIAQDEGNSYRVLTDDLTCFIKNEKWLIKNGKESYNSFLTEIEMYNAVFELAKAVIYLPEYFNHFNDDIDEDTIDTDLKKLIKNPIKKRKYKNVDPKYKIRNRSLFKIESKKSFDSDSVILKDSHFHIKSGGYWKKLEPDIVGTDKKGKAIKGKTWVATKESYYEAKDESLIINNNSSPNYTNKEAGNIYVMRNPSLDQNVFKIGLTTKTPEERAKQLSKTSIPDRFYVMSDWHTKNCAKAEKEIHDRLKYYRVDERREFFELEMKEITKTVNEIVDKINNE